MILFNRPDITSLEHEYVIRALSGKLCGDGYFTKEAETLFEQAVGVPGMLLVTSCTHALEIAALLYGVGPGDEVILPSYTFTSTANAFLLRGAKLVFCDIHPETMNMDERLLLGLITSKTKIIVPVHYAGIPCKMDVINRLAGKYSLHVIEDAAQAVGSTYKNNPCGALADIGCYSFHESKNYVMGEGGGIYIRNQEMRSRAEIIREKGTDRSRFFRGEVNKYSWQQLGSSYLPSDILAALLCAQLVRFNEITQSRMNIWNTYHAAFEPLEENGWRRPLVPDFCIHNAHMYYLIAPSVACRSHLIAELKKREIQAVSHYEPLHAASMGLTLGYKPEDLPLTLEYAARLIRLPLWVGMSQEDVFRVIEAVFEISSTIPLSLR